MQFMLIYSADPATAPAEDSPEAAAEFQQWLDLAAEMKAAGSGCPVPH
ncbi:MAG: hypothetical protein ACK5LS_06085 [Propioniciclava sp.]